MRPALVVALAAALLPVSPAPASPDEGGDKAPATPDAEAEWITLRNDMETIEIRVPPGFVAREITNPNLAISGGWTEGPYNRVIVKGFRHEGKWADLEKYMEVVEKDVEAKSIEYVEGSKSRFTAERPGTEGKTYVVFAEGQWQKEQSYYVSILVEMEAFQKDREVWTKVLDSFKTKPAPEDPFKVGPGWKVLKTMLFGTLGPLNDIQDKKAKDLFDRRLFEVNVMLDDNDDRIRFVRGLTDDKRTWTRRRPIHVYPSAEVFKAACGDAWVEGASAIYLPDHPERILAIDGTPGVVLDRDEIVSLASVSYLDGRLGRLPAWMRVAFREYILNAYQRQFKPGLFPDTVLKRANALFSKNPLPFEEALKLDAAGARALDDNGRLACWGYLQYGLHGPDAPVRDLFRGFLKSSVGAEEASVAWEKAVAAFKESTKKPFKPKDFENGAKKWLKSLK